MRAINLYAHYSAYVQGIHRLQLAGHFTAEVTESIGHANIVRSAIVKLGRGHNRKEPHPILHTTNYIDMLKQAYETEIMAGNVYGEILKP